MSLSAPFIPVAFKDALDQTEPYWDYVFGNESEARAWAQSHNLNVWYDPVGDIEVCI
jgi:adenosine kinase